MTRAQGPDAAIDYRVFGAPGAERVVVLLREGALALADPDPSVTARADLRVVALRVTEEELDDSAVYGGETPAAATLGAVQAIDDIVNAGVFALVAERATGVLAVHLAAALADRVDRLALVAVPRPASALDRDVAAPVLARVRAQTRVFAGEDDPGAAAQDAQWWADGLPDARAVLVPARPGHDRRLALTDVWSPVLAHTAGR